ncbi:MAG: hypothetical protein QM770_11880 [Tepidisphaeraceae bacterium]
MVDIAPGSTTHVSRIVSEPVVRSDVSRVRSIDRVRWGPVIAGLFGTLSVLAVLSVLGLAIGLSTVDRNSDAGNYGIGAGIWGAISALIAFAFGGWLAARSSAVVGRNNGLLQGSMVWMVTIGLLIYVVAGGIGSLFRATASAVTQTASTAVGQATGNTVSNSSPSGSNSVDDAANRASDAAQRTADRTRNAANDLTRNTDAGDLERLAGNSARGAWGTLISMLLGLAAAAIGGYLGARHTDVDYDIEQRDVTPGTAVR